MHTKAISLLALSLKKDINIEEPSINDLCSIGTVARIVKLIKMPDGGTTIIIQGKKKI